MRECARCGSTVSDQYWRVFAVDGQLHGCPECDTKTSDHLPDSNRQGRQSAEG